MSVDALWVAFGFLGQAIFGARFLVQWIASERRGESHIPLVFWWLSIVGAAITLAYAIHKKEWVFIIPAIFGLIVYTRNLILIYRAQRHSATTTSPDRA
ncbi:MAG TPA: lipid-A-disaccharide synthase N-terminal domain-containing protein [Thermoanaerobaculia bacterium]|nr:lipid-A-disaccharide synthase N-terminal domain-containing protein [Thermoanaerobaculia bacterium]